MLLNDNSLVFSLLGIEDLDSYIDFYTGRLNDENGNYYIDYETLAQTIVEDVNNDDCVIYICKKAGNIVGSIKCDCSQNISQEKSVLWGMKLFNLIKYSGICYLGRYCIDGLMIANMEINKGLFSLAMSYAIRKNSFIFLLEGVPRSMKLYQRLGFSPVMDFDDVYIWLEVAKLCPMICNILNFIDTARDKNKSLSLDTVMEAEDFLRLNYLLKSSPLVHMSNEDLILEIK